MLSSMRLIPDVTSFLGSNAGSIMNSIWDFFPAQMMIVRLEGQNDFIVEAVNPSPQARLGDKQAYVGDHLADLLPTRMGDELIASCDRCVKERVSVRYDGVSDGIDRECYGVGWQAFLSPIVFQREIVTHLLCIIHNSIVFNALPLSRQYSDQELERLVMDRTAELLAVNQQLTYLATHDYLTEMHNRRHFLELATTEFRRAFRYGLSVCLMMLDIDHFKAINDDLGHSAGDQALKSVAHAVRTTLRDCDLAGRYGGDEFIIVLTETGIHGAYMIAERLSRTLQNSGLSISIGITALEANDMIIDDMIIRADHLLLDAKRNGRNRIECTPVL
ncbi:GGDEF domain-containing protein [Vreelandella titanicae]|uniref:GGDEF domain-containing protein n=1 Tax=Vreelandella titanicae TaxID=664683 RepID=UPI0037F35637